MITDVTIAIDASPALVWRVFAEVERWPEWTGSVTRLTPLDGADLAVGRRYRIEQPGMPKLVWEVTELEPGVSWTWRQRSPGGTTRASHVVETRPGGGTLVRQRIDQRGPVGLAVALLMRRKTRRFLDLEAQGLKARSEGRLDHDAPSG